MTDIKYDALKLASSEDVWVAVAINQLHSAGSLSFQSPSDGFFSQFVLEGIWVVSEQSCHRTSRQLVIVLLKVALFSFYGELNRTVLSSSFLGKYLQWLGIPANDDWFIGFNNSRFLFGNLPNITSQDVEVIQPN